jgi:AcrR family transcriptional regulator
MTTDHDSPRAAARARVISAALETLERSGFAGTTARAVAATGGFNQALIYYHFPSLDDLLVATLRDFSERRLTRYRLALAGINGLAPLVAAMTRLYDEDVASGQLGAAQEIVAGSSSSERLGQQVVELIEPWYAFAEESVAGLLENTPFEGIVPVKELAYAFVALYFGVETLARLDGNRGKAKALFESGARLARLIDELTGRANETTADPANETGLS